MEAKDLAVKLTKQQQRVLKLLFKFRFVTAQLLADVMGIRRASVYEVLEYLVSQKLLTKIYSSDFRIMRRPAYYYLNKQGVTTVRKLLDVKESVVHTLYKNDTASVDFIELSLQTLLCYAKLTKDLPTGSQIYAKAEINRYSQFPKNRPDLYIRTPESEEAIIIIAGDKPMYIIRKRLDEIITHSEEEGWDGDYPRICFILKDSTSMNSFLYVAKKKLESMGIDEDELVIQASNLTAVNNASSSIWHSALQPKVSKALLA